jgi:hypothetical protein
MTELPDEDWRTVSAEVFSGYRDWRAAHPRATAHELEVELDRRLARLRAQMLADSAMASPAADWASQPPAEQPHCPACAQPLTPRGAHTRRLRSHHDQPVLLTRQYGTCPHCGRGFFPPR